MALSDFNPRTAITWDSYHASGVAEGFDEPVTDSFDETVEAWAYLIATGLAWSLQGWYGRNAANIIEGGTIDKNGHIDWNAVDAAHAEGDE